MSNGSAMRTCGADFLPFFFFFKIKVNVLVELFRKHIYSSSFPYLSGTPYDQWLSELLAFPFYQFF